MPATAGALWNSSRWQRARARFIRDNPSCRTCGAPATVVDHEPPHRGDKAAFWDRSTWQPLCKPCHDRKTAHQDGGFGGRAMPRRREAERHPGLIEEQRP